jgi:Tetracyclin repressor-like, C-terminal domain
VASPMPDVPPTTSAVRSLMLIRAQIDDAFGQRFRTAFLQRRDALAVILDRARARGELPADVSAGTITDIVFGVIWYRMLATRQALDNKLADELTTALAGPPSGSGEPALRASRRKRT